MQAPSTIEGNKRPVVGLVNSFGKAMIGQTLGHYRIEAKLGEGGMGVVYKARDLHLDRLVAVKVLLPEAVANPERRRRFVQEAKSASALNHPNIIHVYDIDTANGVDFIAMEFVEGKTLDELIGRKGLPVREALKYAVQIADALAAAHGSGITHRDIKPGNIMVGERGLVKVLDFGLAKLTQLDDTDDFGATRTMQARTEEGAIIGTVAYMSPEQAEGKKVDARSDIFSFGSVLYEMVTGRRAFQGDTKMSILAAILNREPASTAEAAAVPRDLERIIERCLRKDLARRFQSMADLKVSLEDVQEDAPVPVAPAPQPARWWAIAAALTAALLLGIGVGWRVWHSTAPPPTRGLVLTRLTSDSGLTTDPVLFAPGKLLAYASDRSGEGNLDIWVQQLGSGTPVRLTKDAADERWPTFSPDGTRIAFRTERNGGGIEVAPALGGEPRRIVDGGLRPRFSPDGNWIAYWLGGLRRSPANPADDKVFVAPATGGAPKQIPPGFQNARYPVWSPDGKHLLFAGWPDAKAPPDQSYDWWVAPLDGGTAVKTGAPGVLRRVGLPTFAIPGAWTGNQVVFSARLGDSTSLWQVEIIPGTWQISGAPTRLTTTTGLDAEPSVAADGSLVYAGLTENADIWSLPLDANRGKITGPLQPLTRSAASDTYPSVSLDGEKLVFLSTRTGNSDVWLKNLVSGVETALTVTPFEEERAQISRDGSQTAYAANGAIYVVSIGADGRAGVPAKVCEGCGAPADWAPDGKGLLVVIRRQPNPTVGWLDLASGQHKEILSEPRYFLVQPNFSADGRWISFNVRSKPGRNNIYVAPFRGSAAIEQREWTAITKGDTTDNPSRWSPDGNRLCFFSNRDGSDCIWMQQLDPATKKAVGAPQDVYHLHTARRTILPFPAFGFSVARDKAVFPLREVTGNIWMAKVERQQ